MRVGCQCSKITDSEVRGAGGEDVGEGERTQRCVTTGAAAPDGHPLFVGMTAVRKEQCCVYTVVEVDDAPASP